MSQELEDNEYLPVAKLLDALQSLLTAIPSESHIDLKASPHQRRKLKKQIILAIERLEKLREEADPVRLPRLIFDPADAAVVGELIANTLLIQERQPLASLFDFYGSGVYAIYYNGAFDAYQTLVGNETPVYVGKADPERSNAITAVEQGKALRNRLAEHAKTIAAADNLNLDDFDLRYLVVRSAWQGTAEHYLINRFQPIWNKETRICYGFGKHGDAATTRRNERSPWDTLHPGRKWATGPENTDNRRSIEQIKASIADHFHNFPPVKKV